MTHLRCAIVVLLALALGGCAALPIATGIWGAIDSGISIWQRDQTNQKLDRQIELMEQTRLQTAPKIPRAQQVTTTTDVLRDQHVPAKTPEKSFLQRTFPFFFGGSKVEAADDEKNP